MDARKRAFAVAGRPSRGRQLRERARHAPHQAAVSRRSRGQLAAPRRAFWNYDFLGKLNGVEAYLGERKIKFQGRQPKPMMLRLIGKLGADGAHPMIEHFKFVAAHAKAMPKMTIPSPSSLHFRYGRDAVPASAKARTTAR